jgi:hypothetical protein
MKAKDWLWLGMENAVLTKAKEKELDDETNGLAIFRRGWDDGSRQSRRFKRLRLDFSESIGPYRPSSHER